MEYLVRLKDEKLKVNDSESGSDMSDLDEQIKAVQDGIDNLEKLRFQVGDRVKCRCDGGWKEGTIYRLNWRGDDELIYFRTAAYQIRLNNDACRCKGVCSCGIGPSGIFVYSTFDVEENVTKADEHHVSKKIAGPKSSRKHQLKTGRIEFAVAKPKMLQLLRSVTAAKGGEWLTEYPFEHLIMSHSRVIAPRQRFFNELEVVGDDDDDDTAAYYHMIDNDSAARTLAAFIGTEGIATLEAKAARGCADSMLKLGDAYMFALHMPQDQRNAMKACDYYNKAAELDQPEACVAVAMMADARLFTHLSPHVRTVGTIFIYFS